MHYQLITRRYYNFQEIRGKHNYDNYSKTRDIYYYDTLEEAIKEADKFMDENHTDCSYSIQEITETSVNGEFLSKCNKLAELLSDEEFTLLLDRVSLLESYQTIRQSAEDLKASCDNCNVSTTTTDANVVLTSSRFTTSYLCILCSNNHTLGGCNV